MKKTIHLKMTSDNNVDLVIHLSRKQVDKLKEVLELSTEALEEDKKTFVSGLSRMLKEVD